MTTSQPAPQLQNTNWLTNAYDAEVGMDVVYAEPNSVRRVEITKVEDGVVWTEDGDIDCELINNVDHVVIE